MRMTVSSFTPSRIGIMARLKMNGDTTGAAGAALALAHAEGVGAAARGGAGGAGGRGGSGGGAPAQESRKIEETRGDAYRIHRDYTHRTRSRQGPLAIVCDSA